MQFSTLKVTVEEQTGVVHIPITRTGDLSYSSSVVCFTRQKTAQVMMDYDERRNTDEFRIVFLPGERVSCYKSDNNYNDNLNHLYSIIHKAYKI